MFTVKKDLQGRSQLVGDQPEGEMTLEHQRRSVPGYPKHDSIKITFVFVDGIQTVSLRMLTIIYMIRYQ